MRKATWRKHLCRAVTLTLLAGFSYPCVGYAETYDEGIKSFKDQDSAYSSVISESGNTITYDFSGQPETTIAIDSGYGVAIGGKDPTRVMKIIAPKLNITADGSMTTGVIIPDLGHMVFNGNLNILVNTEDFAGIMKQVWQGK